MLEEMFIFLKRLKESAEIFIAAGANLNTLNLDGLTPLDNFLTNFSTTRRQTDKDKHEFEGFLRKHGAKASEELVPYNN